MSSPSPSVTPTDPSALAQTATPPSVRKKKQGQGVFCIWHGLDWPGLIRLMRMKPPMDWSRTLRIGSLGLTATTNSMLRGLESLLYGRKIARTEITQAPIFVLGHWRSGTTLLHNLMTLDPRFTYPNLYQTLYPTHFLCSESVVSTITAPLLPKTRPMDNMPAGWKLPQEDELSLLLLHLLSPYLMLVFQGDRSKYGHTFDIRDMSPADQEQWKKDFLLILKKLTVRENKPIIIKSPSHTYRIATLLEMFPNAKFVYIYRDPYAVYSSSVHLRHTLFAENGLCRPITKGLEEDTLKTYDHCIRTYEATKHLIPAGNLYELQFEKLEADPLGRMKDVYDNLNLGGWETVEPLVRREVPALTEYKKNKFLLDEASMRKVYAMCRDHFERYGYDSRLDESAVIP